MAQNNQFTEGKIFGPLIKFALPVFFALCLQSLYGAVDLLVVGQFGTAADVSAVSTGSQMMHMVTVVVTGMAMGTTIMLGHAIGCGKKDEAGNIIGNSITFFAIMAIVVIILMVFLSEPFTALLKAPAEAFDKTESYVRICSYGMIFIVAYNVLGSVFRGIGDSATPLITVFCACILNIVGDLFFVAVLDMQSDGAALATVLAQGFSVLLSLIIIKKRGLPFPFSRKQIRFERTIVGKVVGVGAPIALQDGLVAVSFLAIAAIVNSLGVVASAGVGVAEKICGFIMLIPSAFSQSLSAFVAQNIGAGKPARARKAMVCGMSASFAIGVVVAYFSFFHGDILARMFSNDGQVILASADYLRAYAVDVMLVAFLFCFIGYFNGCGNTKFVMIQGIVGAFGVRIPVSYLMSKIENVSLFGIGLATPTSTIVQIILCIVFFRHVLKKEKAVDKAKMKL